MNYIFLSFCCCGLSFDNGCHVNLDDSVSDNDRFSSFAYNDQSLFMFVSIDGDRIEEYCKLHVNSILL
jgi:hypothetical protein